MMGARSILRDVAHRPWPLPTLPWVMFQSWRSLLFAHWRLDPDRIRPLVPPRVELDLHDGHAWVAVTPFLITGLRPRTFPALPGLSSFPELNVRTYVRAAGRPAVYFFSLDAGSNPAVAGARALYRLPYHRADMEISEEAGRCHYRSARRDADARFEGTYRPTGRAVAPEPGTLEHFLTERYALVTVLRNGRVLQADIHHARWPLQPAEAEIRVNTVAAAAGIALPAEPPLLHFSARQDTLVWALAPVEPR